MDAIFDDIATALREPRTDVWAKVRVIALDAAGKFLVGVAIGLGITVGSRLIAG
ncbi:hypothetical protein [Mesorhizobium sp. M00.F.Ca.ET.217.01.1.1]|uniref:hypothetical protein n=1 Tax=Mesorhizobium sp. M00.F.Ca.ET.217.01.1.1 TaxID=2500529 RepID=UPI0016793FC3|nr:hypothetical protein [Mesorhizobium sp. M00.F.Ca.ET.217.01.1.1]